MDSYNKERLIENINMLYPADSHEDGKALLFQAIADRWEYLPDEILKQYYQLCLKKEHKGS